MNVLRTFSYVVGWSSFNFLAEAWMENVRASLHSPPTPAIVTPVNADCLYSGNSPRNHSVLILDYWYRSSPQPISLGFLDATIAVSYYRFFVLQTSLRSECVARCLNLNHGCLCICKQHCSIKVYHFAAYIMHLFWLGHAGRRLIN